jgi:hypothetical protein
MADHFAEALVDDLGLLEFDLVPANVFGVHNY